MGLRELALKPGELKPLGRGGLLLFAARCAMRVEPWRPRGAGAAWGRNLSFVVASASGGPTDLKAAARSRDLSDRGAVANNRLCATDEPLGRCMSYAMSTLAQAVEATTVGERPELLKAVIECAKFSASIAAIWAHAGRVRVSGGGDPVDFACLTTWSAIRRDIEPVATATEEIRASRNPVRALRDVAPLWQGRAPAWASPR